MSERADRRTNTALRRRIDHLLGRVRQAREEIVESGLGAVDGSKPAAEADGQPIETAPDSPLQPPTVAR
jgi:hypothetical protein